MFGADNCEVTGLILDEWRFPRELGGALRAHYLARSTDRDSQLACLLNVASGLTHQEGCPFAGEESWWEMNQEKLRAAGVTPDQLSPATADANAAFTAAVAALAA